MYIQTYCIFLLQAVLVGRDGFHTPWHTHNLAHVSSVYLMMQACNVQKNHCIILQAPAMVCVCRSVTIDPEECHLFKENFVELNKTPTEMHTS